MSAQNSFKGKFNEGLFANGQGPIHGLEIKKEAEEKGVLNSSDRNNLKIIGGQNDGLMGRSEDRGFDLYSSSYRGPENWQPENKGVVSNFDINK